MASFETPGEILTRLIKKIIAIDSGDLELISHGVETDRGSTTEAVYCRVDGVMTISLRVTVPKETA